MADLQRQDCTSCHHRLAPAASLPHSLADGHSLAGDAVLAPCRDSKWQASGQATPWLPAPAPVAHCTQAPCEMPSRALSRLFPGLQGNWESKTNNCLMGAKMKDLIVKQDPAFQWINEGTERASGRRSV